MVSNNNIFTGCKNNDITQNHSELIIYKYFAYAPVKCQTLFFYHHKFLHFQFKIIPQNKLKIISLMIPTNQSQLNALNMLISINIMLQQPNLVKDGVLIYLLSYTLIKNNMSSESTISYNNPKLNRILEPENTNLQDNVKERVKQKLMEDAQVLLEKKRKEEEKRERVRKMEEEFQKQRLNRLNKMNQKQVKTQGLLEKNKQELNKKFKQKSQNFKKIISKIEHTNQQQIEKALSMQKQYQASYNNSKHLSRSSKNHNLLESTRSHSVRLQLENIDQKIARIMAKSSNAQQKHELQNKMLVNRIKQRSSSVNQAQKRAMHQSYIEQTQKLRNFYQKTEQLHKIAYNSKSANEKRLTQKRRSVKQKLDKCSQNLKYISQKQQEKYHELQMKLSKKVEPKQWKDNRLQKYKQKWQQNSRKLQLQKQQKAEHILQKHQQISQQNKVYKQQKDKLMQAVKQTH